LQNWRSTFWRDPRWRATPSLITARYQQTVSDAGQNRTDFLERQTVMAKPVIHCHCTRCICNPWHISPYEVPVFDSEITYQPGHTDHQYQMSEAAHVSDGLGLAFIASTRINVHLECILEEHARRVEITDLLSVAFQ
jgi:hypothetical protein